jgi:hypothetical protein
MTDNTDIAVRDTESEISVLPPGRPATSTAVATLQQHAVAMQSAYELAEKLVLTEMVPTRFRRQADDATAAILYGAELGLNPIQALQNVFAVNGSPAIYARTMGALLKAKGYKFRTVEKTNEAVEIHGWEPGRNPDTDIPDEESRWTIEDAAQAGYTSNKKYETDPRAMLYAKSLSEVCRHLAPHVLLGIAYSVEELEVDQSPTGAVKRPGGSGVGGMRAARERREQQRQDVVDAETVDDGTSGEADAHGNWTPEARRKGLNRLHQLFGKGDLPKDARDDRLIVTSHIIGRSVNSSNELTDDEIAGTNHKLGKWDEARTLGQKITEILNIHAIKQAEAAETSSTTTEGDK